MRIKKLFMPLAILSVLLIAGCNKENFLRNNLNLANSATTSIPAITSGTVPLGTAASFAVLGGTTVTNAETSVITGDLGVSPVTAITGFQPTPINNIQGPGTVTTGLGLVNGTIYAGGPVALQAHMDAIIAYNYLMAQAITNQQPAIVNELGGLTLTPGIYNYPSSAELGVGEILTLDFQGNSNAVFIFQIVSTLVTFHDSKIVALNAGTSTCLGSNVFWAVGSSATINGAEFIGTVIANTTITMTTAANIAPLASPADTINVFGRMLALHGEVTMVNENISTCGTSGGGTNPPPQTCRDFVTGGGWILFNSDGHGNKHNIDRATFGVSGGIKNGKFWGQLSYNDHNGVQVKSTSVTGYQVIDAVTRQIDGIAKVNGHGSFAYTVVVKDNGEPGRNDSFSIVLSNGYSASATLLEGNIQLHMKCEDSHDKGDKCDKEDYNDNNENDGNKNCDNGDRKDDDHGRN